MKSSRWQMGILVLFSTSSSRVRRALCSPTSTAVEFAFFNALCTISFPPMIPPPGPEYVNMIDELIQDGTAKEDANADGTLVEKLFKGTDQHFSSSTDVR